MKVRMWQIGDWNMWGLTALPYLEVGDPVVVFPLVKHIVVVGTLLLTEALRSPAHKSLPQMLQRYGWLFISRNNIHTCNMAGDGHQENGWNWLNGKWLELPIGLNDHMETSCSWQSGKLPKLTTLKMAGDDLFDRGWNWPPGKWLKFTTWKMAGADHLKMAEIDHLENGRRWLLPPGKWRKHTPLENGWNWPPGKWLELNN